MKQRAPKSLALPQNKHRKLLDLRGHVPRVSKAALERILKYMALEGLPGQRSAKAMRQASKGLVDEANGYGPLLVLQDVVGQDGSISRVQFLNYCSFLHYAYKQGGGFYRAMKTQLDKHAGHLGLCLYSDEVCPGNVLAPDTTRKCWVVYAGLKEMDSLLSSEHAWVTLCIVRSSLVARLEANISQIMGRVLQLVFENPWCDVQHAGMLLQPPPEHAGAAPRRLFLKLALFIQDGQAQKMTWSVKGDSGSRFCSLCSNCFSHETDEDGLHVACRFTAHSQLVQHTSQEMFESWDRMALRAETCSSAEFKDWQQATGITYSKEALLACPSLRHLLEPTQQWMHDYMHCLLANGLLAFGTFYLLDAMKGWATFAGYVALWHLPSQFKHLKIEKIFTNKRLVKHRASGKLNCSASELLTLLPVLAHFIRPACGHELPPDATAFLAMNAVLEALHAGCHCRPADWRSALSAGGNRFGCLEEGWLAFQEEEPLAAAHALCGAGAWLVHFLLHHGEEAQGHQPDHESDPEHELL